MAHQENSEAHDGLFGPGTSVETLDVQLEQMQLVMTQVLEALGNGAAQERVTLVDMIGEMVNLKDRFVSSIRTHQAATEVLNTAAETTNKNINEAAKPLLELVDRLAAQTQHVQHNQERNVLPFGEGNQDIEAIWRTAVTAQDAQQSQLHQLIQSRDRAIYQADSEKLEHQYQIMLLEERLKNVPAAGQKVISEAEYHSLSKNQKTIEAMRRRWKSNPKRAGSIPLQPPHASQSHVGSAIQSGDASYDEIDIGDVMQRLGLGSDPAAQLHQPLTGAPHAEPTHAGSQYPQAAATHSQSQVEPERKSRAEGSMERVKEKATDMARAAAPSWLKQNVSTDAASSHPHGISTYDGAAETLRSSSGMQTRSGGKRTEVSREGGPSEEPLPSHEGESGSRGRSGTSRGRVQDTSKRKVSDIFSAVKSVAGSTPGPSGMVNTNNHVFIFVDLCMSNSAAEWIALSVLDQTPYDKGPSLASTVKHASDKLRDDSSKAYRTGKKLYCVTCRKLKNHGRTHCIFEGGRTFPCNVCGSDITGNRGRGQCVVFINRSWVVLGNATPEEIAHQNTINQQYQLDPTNYNIAAPSMSPHGRLQQLQSSQAASGGTATAPRPTTPGPSHQNVEAMETDDNINPFTASEDQSIDPVTTRRRNQWYSSAELYSQIGDAPTSLDDIDHESELGQFLEHLSKFLHSDKLTDDPHLRVLWEDVLVFIHGSSICSEEVVAKSYAMLTALISISDSRNNLEFDIDVTGAEYITYTDWFKVILGKHGNNLSSAGGFWALSNYNRVLGRGGDIRFDKRPKSSAPLSLGGELPTSFDDVDATQHTMFYLVIHFVCIILLSKTGRSGSLQVVLQDINSNLFDLGYASISNKVLLDFLAQMRSAPAGFDWFEWDLGRQELSLVTSGLTRHGVPINEDDNLSSVSWNTMSNQDLLFVHLFGARFDMAFPLWPESGNIVRNESLQTILNYCNQQKHGRLSPVSIATLKFVLKEFEQKHFLTFPDESHISRFQPPAIVGLHKHKKTVFMSLFRFFFLEGEGQDKIHIVDLLVRLNAVITDGKTSEGKTFTLTELFMCLVTLYNFKAITLNYPFVLLRKVPRNGQTGSSSFPGSGRGAGGGTEEATRFAATGGDRGPSGMVQGGGNVAGQTHIGTGGASGSMAMTAQRAAGQSGSAGVATTHYPASVLSTVGEESPGGTSARPPPVMPRRPPPLIASFTGAQFTPQSSIPQRRASPTQERDDGVKKKRSSSPLARLGSSIVRSRSAEGRITGLWNTGMTAVMGPRPVQPPPSSGSVLSTTQQPSGPATFSPVPFPQAGWTNPFPNDTLPPRSSSLNPQAQIFQFGSPSNVTSDSPDVEMEEL